MIRIQPKEYISEKFVIDYYGYTKKEAIKLYLEKFRSFKLSEIKIE